MTQCSAAVELDGELVGCINVHDEVRSDAKDVVSQLESMGVDVYICTGDESEAARRVAEECGISMDRVFTGVMPEEKGEGENLRGEKREVEKACRYARAERRVPSNSSLPPFTVVENLKRSNKHVMFVLACSPA